MKHKDLMGLFMSLASFLLWSFCSFQAHAQFSPKNQYNFPLSMVAEEDFKEIKIILRNSHKGKFMVHFESVNPPSLEQPKLSFKAFGVSHKGKLLLNQFDFEKGSNPRSEVYRVTIYRWVKNNELGSPYYQLWWEDKVFITDLSLVDFLAEYKRRNAAELLAVFDGPLDIISRVATLRTMTDKIIEWAKLESNLLEKGELKDKESWNKKEGSYFDTYGIMLRKILEFKKEIPSEARKWSYALKKDEVEVMQDRLLKWALLFGQYFAQFNKQMKTPQNKYPKSFKSFKSKMKALGRKLEKYKLTLLEKLYNLVISAQMEHSSRGSL